MPTTARAACGSSPKSLSLSPSLSVSAPGTWKSTTCLFLSPQSSSFTPPLSVCPLALLPSPPGVPTVGLTKCEPFSKSSSPLRPYLFYSSPSSHHLLPFSLSLPPPALSSTSCLLDSSIFFPPPTLPLSVLFPCPSLHPFIFLPLFPFTACPWNLFIFLWHLHHSLSLCPLHQSILLLLPITHNTCTSVFITWRSQEVFIIVHQGKWE